MHSLLKYLDVMLHEISTCQEEANSPLLKQQDVFHSLPQGKIEAHSEPVSVVSSFI